MAFTGTEMLKADKVLTVGQRMEFFLSNGEEQYSSRIEDIMDDKLIVAMPFDSKLRPIIPAKGETLYGRAIGKGCRYRLCTVFIDKKAEPIPVWIITKPDMVEKMQSRSYHRVRKSLPVRVSLIDTDGTREEPFDTHTVDLSGGGVRIVVPRRVAVGSHAALEFNNFADIGTLRVMCRIARCVDVGHDEHIYHAGAVFKDLPRLILNRLVKYIFSIEREELAKGLETR